MADRSDHKLAYMSLEKFNLKGKVALITGAGGLLGIEHAKALLSAGANLVLTDISNIALMNTSKILRAEFQSSCIKTFEMDVSNEESILAVSEQLQSSNCCIDILVNNAAIDPKVTNSQSNRHLSRVEFLSLEQWNAELSVGLTGAFLCCRIFGHQMVMNKRPGVILNIASDLSIISPDQRLYQIRGLESEKQPVKPVTYSVIKTGLIGLTKYLSTYWAEYNIRVNALSPGGVFNNQPNHFIEKLNKLIPLNRMANKDEYRSAILFLCSDASSYMTGQNIVMDGGRSVW